MRKLPLLLAVLLALCLVPLAAAEETEPLYEVFTYGYSVQGRELQCHRIGDPEAEHSFLWVFAVHGFEDSFKQDGQVLTQIAELMIEHYRTHATSLNDYALYIVPAANPDGQLEGRSKDGFGRCNADGIDINRDFPVGWKKMTTARYKTGSEPFSTPEARYLRDLAQQIMPTYGADVHGWINRVYGEPDLAQPFMDAFGFRYKEYKSGGMLSQWLAEFTEGSLLIELPDRARKEGFAEDCAAKLIAGLDAWIAQTSQD
jgi:hypothetical protein